MTDRPAHISRDEAVNLLAHRLHWKMEHLDPTERPNWDDLNERERSFYRCCVEAIFDERELVRTALG